MPDELRSADAAQAHIDRLLSEAGQHSGPQGRPSAGAEGHQQMDSLAGQADKLFSANAGMSLWLRGYSAVWWRQRYLRCHNLTRTATVELDVWVMQCVRVACCTPARAPEA
jgi:hypothetical protein